MAHATIELERDHDADREAAADKAVPVRTVARALSILQAFRPSRRTLTLTEVVHATGLDKGTARRMLQTLVQYGFVSHEPLTQKFSLGPEILNLAAALQSNVDLREIMRPALTNLGNDTQTTVHLAVLRDNRAVCIERYQPEGAAVLVHHWSVGGQCPLNGGAAPRVLFAHMPDENIAQLLDGESPYEDALAQPVNRKKILRSIQEIRQRGWAISADEVAPGLTALGAPVRDGRGDVVAAISMVGLSPQMQQRQADFVQRMLRATAAASRSLA